MKTMQNPEARTYDGVRLLICPDRDTMGKQAAAASGETLRSLLLRHAEVNCIFAAAPSQHEFLTALVEEPGIDWTRINGFHMDEYVGLAPNAEQTFRHFLFAEIFSRVPFRQVFYINDTRDANPCPRYAKLLADYPIDVVFMGIGENGHIAFNDPLAADFQDPEVIKIVNLELACRLQQVHDGCFPTLDDVPLQAISLTIPTLIRPPHLFCIVPSLLKAQAVHDALLGEISTACPASILRTTKNTRMFIDQAAASLLG